MAEAEESPSVAICRPQPLAKTLIFSSPNAALFRGVQVQGFGHWTGSSAMRACTSTSPFLSSLPFSQASKVLAKKHC